MSLVVIQEISSNQKVEKMNVTESSHQIYYNNLIINITTLDQGIPQYYPINDARIVMYEQNQNASANYTGYLIVTFNNEGSYSNELFVYNLSVDYQNNLLFSELISTINADDINADTFKVNRITIFPNSSIAVIVADDFGAYFYDLISNEIVNEICLISYDLFYQQNLKTEGEFIVYNAIGDWPYSLHFLTNYGIFYFDFPVDLTNRTLLDSDLYSNLIPYNSRIIRLSVDRFKHEVVGNQWGYAFLLEYYDSPESFNVYLGSVSYYSSTNSKLFRLDNITHNQHCHSLNIQQTSVIDNGDENELEVTFICGTQLQMRGICMRPNIIIDMSEYFLSLSKKDSKSTLEDGIGGQLSYNKFNITVTSSNGNS